MRATRAAGFGAAAERFRHDLLDGSGAPSALGAAAEASIELLGGSGNLRGGSHRASHILIA